MIKRPVSPPRLAVELVPATQWGSNLRSALTASEWNRCKKWAKEKSGDRCEICGGVGTRYTVACHEQWSYDEAAVPAVQTLVGLIALCPPCHDVKHFGHVTTLGNPEYVEAALRHLASVNGWSLRQAKAHTLEVREEWLRRSRLRWRIDLSWVTRELRISVIPPLPPEIARLYTEDNPFPIGTEEHQQHDMYIQQLADRDD